MSATATSYLDTAAADDAPAAAAPEVATLPCPECGEQITGKAHGSGSAAWKLSTHRRMKHGVQGSGKAKRPRAGAPSEAEHMAHPVLSAIRESASEVGAGKNAPSIDQLAAGLGRGLGISTMAVATLAVATDPMMTGAPPEMADRTITLLTLADADARALMHPIARILAPTSINTKYGRQVVDNVDVVGSVAALLELGMHWRDYLRARAEWMAQSRAGLAPAPLLAPPPTMAPDLAGRGLIRNGDGDITAPPTNGRVLTPADIQRLQAVS